MHIYDILIKLTNIVSIINVRIVFVSVPVRYIFWTDKYDIKYEIYYKASETSPAEVLQSIARVNSHLVPEDGYMPCNKIGTCKFWYQLTTANSDVFTYRLPLLPTVGTESCLKAGVVLTLN